MQTISCKNYIQLPRGTRFPGVIFGDAAITIPQAINTRLKNASDPGTTVFMDGVTSKECVDGSIPERLLFSRCESLNTGYWPSVRAYNVAVLEGWLRVKRCAWPTAVRADGICMGYFV